MDHPYPPRRSNPWAIRVKADAKAYPEAFRILDDELLALRDPARVAERARTSKSAKSSASAATMPPLRRRFYIAPQQRASITAIDFPTAGPYLDHGALQLLRNAFGIFQRDDLLSDLRVHLKKLADDATGRPLGRRYHASGLLRPALVARTSGTRRSRELARAVELAPGDAELTSCRPSPSFAASDGSPTRRWRCSTRSRWPTRT